MSKTIKQIAEEIGVSKQAVYKRYKGKLYTVVAPHTHTVDGTVYIKEQGENIIKQDFNGGTISKKADTGAHTDIHTEHSGAHTEYTPNQTDKVLDVLQETIAELKNELSIKNEQIKEKDSQINELISTIKTQSQSINADRHKQLAETIQNKMLDTVLSEQTDEPLDTVSNTNAETTETKQTKQTLWSKIFNK